MPVAIGTNPIMVAGRTKSQISNSTSVAVSKYLIMVPRTSPSLISPISVRAAAAPARSTTSHVTNFGGSVA